MVEGDLMFQWYVWKLDSTKQFIVTLWGYQCEYRTNSMTSGCLQMDHLP